jgi:hypothetical protein
MPRAKCIYDAEEYLNKIRGDICYLEDLCQDLDLWARMGAEPATGYSIGEIRAEGRFAVKETKKTLNSLKNLVTKLEPKFLQSIAVMEEHLASLPKPERKKKDKAKNQAVEASEQSECDDL